MAGTCLWSLMAAQLLAAGSQIGPTLPPGPADQEFVHAGTRHETAHPLIIPEQVRRIEIDPCPPPEKPCC